MLHEQNWEALDKALEGSLHRDKLQRTIYATDASVYRKIPLAVVLPRSVADLQILIQFAKAHQTSLIPRAAGTSLAGQCVGAGIVVDISKHFDAIIECNTSQKWVRVQPGVIRDVLNHFLEPKALFFGPITSTANRATLGGMVANNACGTNSIVYGSTRTQVLEIKALLSDGSEVMFGELSASEFEEKCLLQNLEGALYRQISELLNDKPIQQLINDKFPKASVKRRNTGYALDALLDCRPFGTSNNFFNFCKLICGSEGSLAFITEIKLKLEPLPPAYSVVLVPHFKQISDCLKAVPLAMSVGPVKCEMMDKIILDCTKENKEQSQNRHFVQGDPAALLMVEFAAETEAAAEKKAIELIAVLQAQNIGYAYPLIGHSQTAVVWQLRAAGLGLLANIPGDKKSVTCIEDTAVDVHDLVDYIGEFQQIMASYHQQAVIYAHAGAGELHLRPVLNLKKQKDVDIFYQISEASARLVKKYRGALSGEHGDGRLRAPFIPMVMGEQLYQIFRQIKAIWDPQNIFNPGKIVDAPAMTSDLRYIEAKSSEALTTMFSFTDTGGILRAAEKCNGSADCRKLPLSGGTMCPSYHASGNEKDTTRARANMLRECLTQTEGQKPFDHPELYEVMQLCISCKACASECPSNVDMSTLKAEFLYQYYQSNRTPLRSQFFAYFNQINRLSSKLPKVYNFLASNTILSKIPKMMMGIAPQRSLPLLASTTLFAWYQKQYKQPLKILSTVYLFCDEFTNYLDTEIGIKALQLLSALGYDVKIIAHPESGRAALSKGMLAYAQKVANKNVALFSDCINDSTPLIGIEPSAILSFRDEYPRLVDRHRVEDAQKLSNNCLLIDEFLYREIQKGNISSSSFTKAPKQLLFHGHCHQKALTDVSASIWCLSLPENYSVQQIPSGCCGMAGSFGYESEHYSMSMQIASLVLFPAIASAPEESCLVATGTSCRCQIKDGTKRKAYHPVEVLWEALCKSDHSDK